MMKARVLRFGPFVYEVEAERLSRDGEVVHLAPQPLRLLQLLLEESRGIVSREQVRECLWGDRLVDYDQGINFCVRQLRQVLGDRADAPCFIETVPGRGFRFLAEVEEVSPDQPPSAPTRPPLRAGWRVLAGLLSMVLVAFMGSRVTTPGRGKPIVVEGVKISSELSLVPYLADALEETLRERTSGLSTPKGTVEPRLRARLDLAEDGLRLELSLSDSGSDLRWKAAVSGREEQLKRMERDLLDDLEAFLGERREGRGFDEQTVVRTGS